MPPTNMQTFLTSYDLVENARCLDNRRLFKQLLEGKQILSVLCGKTTAWQNHPAVKMWRGHAGFFVSKYLLHIAGQLRIRHIAENSSIFDDCTYLAADELKFTREMNPPSWWNREDITASHRSRLLCKGEIEGIIKAGSRFRSENNVRKHIKAVFCKEVSLLKASDIPRLKDVLGVGTNYTNHYKQFGWKEPLDLEYVWPVE